jgi:hypothetical protein
MIYLFQLKPINIFNLHLALWHESANNIYGACSFSINNVGDIIPAAGDFVKSQTSDPINKFRSINWNESIDNLNDKLKQAQASNKILVFGTYLSDQVAFLKTQYKSNIVTIGTKFNENMYPLLLRCLAKKHINLLKNNQITANEFDQEAMRTKSPEELIDHYSKIFDQQHMIPKTDCDLCDYIIPLDDFFDLSALANHFKQLNMPLNGQAITFYNQWLSLNQTSV